jgi:hypothetical protein
VKEKKLLYYPGLTASIFVAHYFSTFLEEMVVAGDKFAWVYLFFWYMVFLIAADKLLQYYKIK